MTFKYVYLFLSIVISLAIHLPVLAQGPLDKAYKDMLRGADKIKRMGQVEEALKMYAAAIQMKPGDPAAYYRIGWIHFRASEYEKAEIAFRDAYTHDTSSTASRNLGKACSRNGKSDEALKYFNEAIERDDNNRDNYMSRADHYAKTKAFEKAVTDYRTALKKETKYPVNYQIDGVKVSHEAYILEKLGVCLLSLNDKKGALGVFEESLKLAPGYKAAEEGIESSK